MRTLLIAAFGFVAGAAGVGYFPGVGAQPASFTPSGGDELRAVYATAPDVAEGKRVAESSCKGCHGITGISTTKEVPHIAGQRAGYLHAELRIYKQGARGESPMANAVKLLSDDALMKAAAYYATLDPAQPAAAAAKAASAKPDPVQAGKAASAGCAGCHGENGVSKTPGMPSLVGLDPKYIAAAIAAYKSGQRKNDLMKSLVAALSDADVNNIALFYALQKPAAAQSAAPGDAAAGKAASAACAGCHGEQGVSGTATTPSLAGQEAQYFAAALRSYKDGARSNDLMKAPAASLDDRAVKDLAAYYATQPPQAPKVRKPMTADELAERCDRCHGVNGNSIDPRSPALAAQRADYLEKALHAYRKGTRKSTAMAAMSEMLSETDVESIAAHYSRQKARAVVYVQVPGK
ncbi:MAG: c-type cytochrome [Usitatibacter sp.]